MTRSNPGTLHSFDPEIDRTFHRLNRESRNPSLGSDSDSVESLPHSVHSVISSNSVSNFSEHSDIDNMAEEAPHERTLREMAAPNFTYESMCIQYPEETVPFVLKTGLIHLLPKFHGLAGEDPHKHLKEFHIVCSSMKPQNVQEDYLFLKAFPHSLDGKAKDWLFYLSAGSITSWDDLKKMFLEKFFPASRTTAIRKEISGIRQLVGESLYEYWERFKRLCSSCPHHQISEQLLLQYFYEGLNSMERSMIDAASGGALGDMTPARARDLIEKMASNSQQFSGRNDAIVIKGVHEVGSNAAENKKLENKIDALATLVTQLAVNQKSSLAKVCSICSSNDHHTNMCPSIQETGVDDHPEAYAATIFNNRPQQQQNYDLSSNRYNPGWRNHPNLRYGNSSQQHQVPFQNNAGPSRPYMPLPIAQQQQQQQVVNAPPPATNSLSLEDLVKQMAVQNVQFQQETRASIQRQEASIQNLTIQMGQMATALNQLQSQNSDKLPAQAVNPPRNVSAITLRSGKTINEPEIVVHNDDALKRKKQAQEVEITNIPSSSTPLSSSVRDAKQSQASIPLPFPPKPVQNKKMEEADKEILETFRKVEVNIPLLDAIKQIPKYAKFLKELCTQKRKLKGNERISIGRNVSALIGKPVSQIPEKCEDPGTFSIPCIIGNNKFENAMLDLGASINVMPLSVYESLSLGPLQPTGVVIQLANRSTVRPAGLVEDVLVWVNELIFPADFYILDMKEGSSKISIPIILGRPFLKTARTKIDVHAGSLSMEVGDTVVRFDILKAMKFPSEDHSVFHIDLLDELIDEHVLDFYHDDDSYTCLACIDSDDVLDVPAAFVDLECTNPLAGTTKESDLLPELSQVATSTGLTPSSEQPPTVELKPLPKNLKYAYLEDDEFLNLLFFPP